MIQKFKLNFIFPLFPSFKIFQLFNFSMCTEYPQSSTDASSDDIKFRDKFELRKNIKNFIIHLGTDSNWKGRKSKSFLEYKQFNFL